MSARTFGRDDWDDFRVFAAVARSGSLRRAARELAITAPAVSRRIAHLEHSLGVRLLNRITHGVELTAEGQRVLSFAQVAETALQRAVSASRDPADATAGECRIALADGMGTYWLPRFLAAFARRHPDIGLHIVSSPDRAGVKNPSHDIRIQYTETPDPNLVALRVATLHCMLFASTQYLVERGTPATLGDLAHHRLVDLTLVASTMGTFSALAGFGTRPAVMVNANGAQCEAIRWSAGIGILPTYATMVYENLVPLIPSVHYSFPVFLCFERDVARQPVVRATLDFLRDVVFSRLRMPWFADAFALPDPQWGAILRRCMEDGFERSEALAGAR